MDSHISNSNSIFVVVFFNGTFHSHGHAILIESVPFNREFEVFKGIGGMD